MPHRQNKILFAMPAVKNSASCSLSLVILVLSILTWVTFVCLFFAIDDMRGFHGYNCMLLCIDVCELCLIHGSSIYMCHQLCLFGQLAGHCWSVRPSCMAKSLMLDIMR